MKAFHAGWVVLVSLGVLGAWISGGCPTQTPEPTDGNTPGGGTDGDGSVDTSVFAVTKTDIRVTYDASLKCGDDLIVFGTGTHTGVSYVVPSAHPTAGTPITGEYRSQGFAVAGKKVLLFNDEGRLTVYDTELGGLSEIPLNEITLESLPATDDEDRDSPVVADGQWAVTRNVAGEGDGGNVLKLLDLSSDPPLITPLQNPPVGIFQMAIDSADEVVVTFSGNKFYVYDISQPDLAPQALDLSTQGGIAGPFAYDAGYILYIANVFPQNMRLVRVSAGTSIVLDTVPAQRLLSLAIKGGKYAYFLDRDAFDTFSVVYRAAVGVVPQATAVTGGVAGDPAAHSPSWDGFGDDVAITPDGRWIFISGNQVILDSAEFLQVSDGEHFGHFASGTGFLNASDVDASADVVAFKIGRNNDTSLGYIILPE